MMKYIIIVFVAVITVFIGGRSLNQAKSLKKSYVLMPIKRSGKHYRGCSGAESSKSRHDLRTG